MTTDKFVNVLSILVYPLCFLVLWIIFVVFSVVYFLYMVTIGSVVNAVAVLIGKNVDDVVGLE